MRRARKTITIRDVAKAANVSVSTVSRVLNDKDDVSAETYDKVQRVIAKLGYSSSLAATSMRSRRTNVFSVLIFDLGDPFSLELVMGVGRAVRGTEYDLIVYSSGRTASSTEPEWERRHLSRLASGITDGTIVVTPTTADLPSAAPLVVVDPHVDNSFPAVIATNRKGAIAATEYLIGLGHRRIGFIGGRAELLSANQRQQGYQEALQRANLPLDLDLIQSGDYTQKAGFQGAQALLRLPDPPTAIFAANDGSAFGVMRAAQDAGLSIPDDLSVIGFDNIPPAAHSIPTLTTVEQPISEMGYVATHMLIKLIQGEPLGSRLDHVPTRLIVRESCRSIK